MHNDIVDPADHERRRNREMRAAIDVMFEALSHIQASLETSSEEKRKETYQTFKEALYDRFEYVLEEQEPIADETFHETGAPDDAELEEDRGAEEDTLDKMWPAIADKT